MSNIVSFEEAKSRRDRSKLAVSTVQNPKDEDHPMSVMKSMSLSGKSESLFLREARKFRFTNMVNPHAFIIMKTSILPPEFPPSSPPPMVA